MLEDRERKALDELERRLAAEDPAFGRSFSARAERLGHKSLRTPAMIIVTGATLLAGLMIMAGSLVGAVAVMVAAALVWMAWRSGATTQGPRS